MRLYMQNKDEFIFIRSIEDVDPKKLTIRDLNKKFIDENGRKYAIKFDLKTKKVQFVRIASSYVEAQRIKQEILKAKNQNAFETQNYIQKENYIETKQEDIAKKNPRNFTNLLNQVWNT